MKRYADPVYTLQVVLECDEQTVAFLPEIKLHVSDAYPGGCANGARLTVLLARFSLNVLQGIDVSRCLARAWMGGWRRS